MTISIQTAQRLQKLPPYLFAHIDRLKDDAIKRGQKLISLSVGDPDLPTPEFIIRRLESAARNPSNHQYPSYWGLLEFRKAVVRWYAQRFGVTLDPSSEILSLIGSKEGIAHIPLAFVNPGDGVLVPDPGYPVYSASTILADGTPLRFPLLEKNSYLPDFSQLESLVRSGPRVKLLFLNYPNNPTAATASLDFFKAIVAFAKKHEIIVCHDNAYSEVYFDGVVQPSFLQVPGAKDVGVEFHSISKTFNMTGWRVGFVVGNARVISGLAQVKTNIDSGIFNACQEAAIEALTRPEPFCTELRAVYQARRDILVPSVRRAGLSCPNPSATFYVWAKVPNNLKSEEYVAKMIQEHGLVLTPGSGFGLAGEGYVRLTLCAEMETLKQVAEILQRSV